MGILPVPQVRTYRMGIRRGSDAAPSRGGFPHSRFAWLTLASCLLQFPGGQDAHSSPIHSKTDATPELWLMAEPSEYNCVVII